MTPIVLGGLVVVLLGTAAVVAGFTLVRDEPPRGRTAPGPTLTAAPPVSPAQTLAAPGSPPTGLTLRDSRDRITLAWTYPAGAEGPVVVSGGRAGQEPRAFQELPAGTTSYIVYGLNENTDYCFSIAVVYSADTIGRAKAVCTSRMRASGGSS